MIRIHADIDALKEFHGALARFRNAQRDIADRVDAEIEIARASLETKARTVNETEERMERIRLWQHRLDQEASEFRDVSGRFRYLMENDLPRAENTLLDVIANLDGARRVQGTGS